jgi:Type I phosphodiesterase / nucleotide pyrophosphatase
LKRPASTKLSSRPWFILIFALVFSATLLTFSGCDKSDTVEPIEGPGPPPPPGGPQMMRDGGAPKPFEPGNLTIHPTENRFRELWQQYRVEIEQKTLGFAVEPEKTPVSTELPKKLVLLGWDGATWHAAKSLLDAGKMPNLSRLLQRGSYGRLKTDVGASPVSWTTIATGKPEQQHGIRTEMIWSGQVTNEHVHAAQIWDMLPRDRFKTIDIYGYYFPPKPEGFNGMVLLPHREHEQVKGECATKGRRVHMLDCLFRSRNFDAVFSHIVETDGVAHGTFSFFALDRLLKGKGVTALPEAAAAVKESADRLAEVYTTLDAMLEPFVEDENTLLIVVSDHGFSAADLNLGMLTFGAQFYRELGAHPGFDRERFEAKVGRSRAVISQEPWTRDVPIARLDGSDDPIQGDVRATIVACESPKGGKCPRKVAKKLRSLMAAVKLSELPVYLEKNEDGKLFFEPNPEVMNKVALENFIQLDGGLFYFSPFQAAHWDTPPGVLILAGPGVKRGTEITEAKLVDIVPTLLALTGLPVAEDLAGKPLIQAIEPKFLEAHPIGKIATYGVGHPVTKQRPPAPTGEEIDRMKTLGYIQ